MRAHHNQTSQNYQLYYLSKRWCSCIHSSRWVRYVL